MNQVSSLQGDAVEAIEGYAVAPVLNGAVSVERVREM